MAILPGIRVIVRRFLCIERRFLRDSPKKFYVNVLNQCALHVMIIDLDRHSLVIFSSLPVALRPAGRPPPCDQRDHRVGSKLKLIKYEKNTR